MIATYTHTALGVLETRSISIRTTLVQRVLTTSRHEHFYKEAQKRQR